MKILVLCYEYPPVGGGGGRVAAQVAAALVQRGHEVKVVTAGIHHLARRETVDGVEVYRPESFRSREDTCSVPEMGMYLVTSFFPALGICKKWRPDVIHAHFAVPTGVLACALSWITKIPFVLTAHLGDVPGGVPEQTAELFKLVDPFARKIWKSATRLTAVSGHVARLAREAYGVSPLIIPNGRPAVKISRLSPSPTPHILFVGRLSVQKNPLLAIQALSRVRDLGWTLEVIGDGPLAAAMRHEVESLGLHDRVIFDGWLGGHDVADRMRRSEVLLMTSLHEGLPMVGVEALQHGLAIVGSAIGGMEDVVMDGKNGFLCALDPESFAKKIRELLTSPGLLDQYRKASLETAPEFDLEKTVGSYEQVLLEASKAKA